MATRPSDDQPRVYYQKLPDETAEASTRHVPHIPTDLTCYDFLDLLIEAVGPRDMAGVLGQAKFVLPKKLRKRPPASGHEAAIRRLEASLAQLQTVEPTADELKLAAEFEFQAAQLKVAFDTGESTLAAVMLCRGLDRFFTGDRGSSSPPSAA